MHPLSSEIYTFTPVERAILQTIAYADVFNFPLTLTELERYLIGTTASGAEVFACIGRLQHNAMIEETEGYFTLAGREGLVALRRERSRRATRLWPLALRYGRWLARVPFVRMVAVTGALSVDNVTSEADIDYLLVTEPGRLWLSRLMVVSVVRWAALFGVKLCPNYIVSETALVFEEQNIYTAHDLAQMVPIAGRETYRRLRTANQWVEGFLPNSEGSPHPPTMPGISQSIPPDRTYLIKRVLEAILRLPWANKLEAWEMQRKIRKFERQIADADRLPDEVSFSADWCKGHFDRHQERSLASFEERLKKLETALSP
jgi:hypothetical protein